MSNSVFEAIDRVITSARQFLSIPFTPEQRQTVKKTLGVEFHEMKLPRPPAVQMKYGMPVPSPASGRAPAINLRYGIMPQERAGAQPPEILPMYGIMAPMAERLYLTEEQKRKIQSVTGCKPCEYIEIHPGMRALYGVPVVGR
jgi:hypothetical protein